MLAAIREAVHGFPGEGGMQSAAGQPSPASAAAPAVTPAAAAVAPPAAGAASIDAGRISTLTGHPRLAGSPKRQLAAVELAGRSPGMSNDAIVNWITTYVSAADAASVDASDAWPDHDGPVFGAGQAMPQVRGDAGAGDPWTAFRERNRT